MFVPWASTLREDTVNLPSPVALGGRQSPACWGRQVGRSSARADSLRMNDRGYRMQVAVVLVEG